MPTFSMRQLLEAGVHFGHNTRRWNPKMETYLFGVRNSIHIIDLQQTVPLLHRALAAVSDTVANGGRVLFVSTKRQATDKIADAAKRCGQYFVNHRWLGGMMTNWSTISNSITRLKDLDAQLAEEETVGLTKKELLRLTRERDKLDRALGGIKEMGGLPDILFVIDTNKEAIAVAEANKLGIPVAAVIDSNSNPDGIDYPIPGNDDAIRAIGVYCDLMVDAVLTGIQKEVTAAKGDAGEADEAPPEKLPEMDAKPDQAAAKGEAPADKPAAEKAEKLAPDEKMPAAEPAEEKAEKPAAEETPADKPAEKKAVKPAPDEKTPAAEPTEEKAEKPAAEGTPADKPAAEKAKKPAPDEKMPAAQPAEEKAEKPAPDEKIPAAEPAEEKAEKPAAEGTPADKPAEKKAEKPAPDEKMPAAEPVEEKAEKPAAEGTSAEKPAEKTAKKPAPDEKMPAAEPVEEKAEKPAVDEKPSADEPVTDEKTPADTSKSTGE